VIPSGACVALTKRFEKCLLAAYHGADDPPDVWTIGWGETNGVQEGDVWTQQQADADLLSRLGAAGSEVSCNLTNGISQNQFDALTDFVYNVGGAAFAGSTLLKCVNASDFSGAAAQFLRWDYANGQPSAGLERRRLAEQALFNS
jgi:lysozyme